MERSMLGIVLKELGTRYQSTKALYWIGLGLLGILKKISNVLCIHISELVVAIIILIWRSVLNTRNCLDGIKKNMMVIEIRIRHGPQMLKS